MSVSKLIYFYTVVIVILGSIALDIRDMTRDYMEYKKWSKSKKYKYIMMRILVLIFDIFLMAILCTLL